MADSSEGFEECLENVVLHTRMKGLQNTIEERAAESDKAAVGKDLLAVHFEICEFLIKGQNEEYQ